MKYLDSIKNIVGIAVHHAGGVVADPYASTINLTAEEVEEIHKNVYNFESSLERFGAYNWYYEPLTRKFTQFRAIGEETMAQKSFNFNTASLCVGGNYIINPKTQKPVDSLSQDNLEDIADCLFKMKKVCNVGYDKIKPHFWYNNTKCNCMPENWGRDLVIKKEIGIMKVMLSIYMKLLDIFKRNPNLAGMEFEDDFLDGGNMRG